MACPRVFVSSTCYDLKYIRENIRYFIRTLGYEPILSEDGAVFYNPSLHTHDACLTEIPNSQIFVLIIGGRYGGKYKESDDSITNREFKEALRLKIPIFALVEGSVYNEHNVFQRNKKNLEVDMSKVYFPSVDSLKIFNFIDEVRGGSVNNALVPFRDFGDIETYLRQQWAGMMFDFLTVRSNEKRVSDTLSSISEMNTKIEMLSEQILASVGTNDAKIHALLYDEMLSCEAIRDIAFWKLRPTPAHVFTNSSFKECVKSLGIELRIVPEDEEEGYWMSQNGEISVLRFEKDSSLYEELKRKMESIIEEKGSTPEAYLKKHMGNSKDYT